MARYIIIGAGAVGASIGARLFENGQDVVLVARGDHYRALRENGLRFATPQGERTLPMPAIDRPEALTPGDHDVLILATKTQDSAAALEAWAGHAWHDGHAPPVILAQNGVENERLALRRFPRVYGMCVWLPATYLQPGLVQAHGTPITGVLHVGRYPHGEDDFAHEVARALDKSGFRAPVHSDVMRWKYAKLLSNLTNAVQALCGPHRSDQAQALHDRVRAEGATVLDAAGIPYASREEQAPLRQLLRLQPVAGQPRGGGSSWQSLARATGSIETDYLNGEIVLLGRQHGVPTPINQTLQHLATAHARAHRGPATLTIADLAAHIEQNTGETTS